MLQHSSLYPILRNLSQEEWDINWNAATIFAQINFLCSALNLLGRSEEAEALRIELTVRQAAFGLLCQNIPTNQIKNQMRLSAEQTWIEYFGSFTWENLHSESRCDFVDAYCAEMAVNAGYYRSWRHVLQSMLHVVERELNYSFFFILKECINSSISFSSCVCK